ncbi:MAG: VOC family protein [Paracoccaceae bacterium]
MKADQGIIETAIYAKDLIAAEAFYRDIFGLETVVRLEGKFVFMRSGQSMLLIFDPDESAAENPKNPIPRHGASGAGHFCFTAANADEVARWRDHFIAHGIAVEHYHIWDESGAHSVYIRDPAGNSVEVAERALWFRG